jgi:hypothetical protein
MSAFTRAICPTHQVVLHHTIKFSLRMQILKAIFIQFSMTFWFILSLLVPNIVHSVLFSFTIPCVRTKAQVSRSHKICTIMKVIFIHPSLYLHRKVSDAELNGSRRSPNSNILSSCSWIAHRYPTVVRKHWPGLVMRQNGILYRRSLRSAAGMYITDVWPDRENWSADLMTDVFQKLSNCLRIKVGKFQ